MEPATPSPTSEPEKWEPPDWLLPESLAVAAHWWDDCERDKNWPETFEQAFQEGYVAGYKRGTRRRAPVDPESPTVAVEEESAQDA